MQDCAHAWYAYLVGTLRYTLIALLVSLFSACNAPNDPVSHWDGAWRVYSAYQMDSDGLTPCSDGAALDKRAPLPAWFMIEGDVVTMIESDGNGYELAGRDLDGGQFQVAGGMCLRQWTARPLTLEQDGHGGLVGAWIWDGDDGAECVVILHGERR